MPSTLAASLTAQVSGSLTQARDLGTGTEPFSLKQALALASGVGVGQCDLCFNDIRTLGASASENLDLAGVLLDAMGATLTFVKVKSLFVVADAGNTNNVEVGAGTTPWIGPFGSATDKWKVGPGGFLFAYDKAGWAVTPATADILKIANGGAGTGVTYSIIILGTSA